VIGQAFRRLIWLKKPDIPTVRPERGKADSLQAREEFWDTIETTANASEQPPTYYWAM
jgi:hypothetical protein